MPPRIQELLQQRNVQIGIAAGVVLIIIIAILMMTMGGNKSSSPGDKPINDEEQRVLASVPKDQVGKAIEIQALMARNNLSVERAEGANNDWEIKLSKGATESDKDRGLIAMVQSGLMDRNVGLEAFDKGDLTASREEKKIKLIRAQQGELARLIRKIDPIEDASVSLSIPEQTLFRNQQKPMSASVQVTVPVGSRLERDKIRSIINLMTGSIQGLDSSHVALTDTNGNVYNSVLDMGSELNDRLEQQDNYMKQKVASQLDRLVGAGHYVVTVSTLLREAPKEMMTQSFDPEGAVVSSRQSFNENLNANARQTNVGGPTSTLLPPGIVATLNNNGGDSRKDYDRNGTEISYENTKYQTYETKMPGMLEDISIAVTIDKQYEPGLSRLELRRLIANAASPKVSPGNVSIASTNFKTPDILTTSKSTSASESALDLSWLPWAAGSLIVCFLLILVVAFMKGGRGNENANMEMQMTQSELQQLKELASQQQAQINATQQQTQQLLEKQLRQIEQQPQMAAASQEQSNQLQQTLNELKETVQQRDLEDEELDLQIKSWIESG